MMPEVSGVIFSPFPRQGLTFAVFPGSGVVIEGGLVLTAARTLLFGSNLAIYRHAEYVGLQM